MMKIMKRRIFTLYLVCMILYYFFSFAPAYGLEERELVAGSAIVIDKVTGRVLFEKNGDEERAMASTTKIMTCIIALENANLSDKIKVSKLASRAPIVKLFIKENEEYILEDLLYALMLESSNDVAIAIAEGVGGSVEAFCDLMTKKAHAIGATHTSYKTPNGLDKEGHYSTVKDLALITKYALDNKKFNDIITTPHYSFNEQTKGRSFSVRNKNAFLNMYKGAEGVKTGFTNKAGYCFVGYAKRDDLELISVVLASGWPPNRTYRWGDTKKLMDYGFKHYAYEDIFDREKIIFRLDGLKFGKIRFVEGKLYEKIRVIKREEEKVHVVYVPKEINEAPIKAGTKIGEAQIFIDDTLYKSVDITAIQTVERLDYWYCVDLVWGQFLGFLSNNQ